LTSDQDGCVIQPSGEHHQTGESPRRSERDHDEQQRGNREKEPKLREQVMRRELERDLQMIVTG
jgi:hypothetical protein